MTVELAITLCAVAALGALAACGSTIASTSEGELGQPIADPFPWKNEEIHFRVEVAGFDALRAGMVAGEETESEEGILYIPITGKASSYGFFDRVFTVRDTGDTYMAIDSLLPYVADKKLDEGGKLKLYSVVFDRDRYEAIVTKEKEGETSVKIVPILPDTYDALAWSYEVRRIPLTPGYSQTWVLYDGWKMSKITITVIGEEQAWCPLGWFDTVRLDAEREIIETQRIAGAIAGSPAPPRVISKKGPYFAGSIWLTADELRRPIRVVFKVKIGEVDLKLIDYKPPS